MDHTAHGNSQRAGFYGRQIAATLPCNSAYHLASGASRATIRIDAMLATPTKRRIGAVLLALGGMAAPAFAADLNDYPTAARADYVFACMKTNGQSRRALEQCSCSIDIIASILPYDRYVTAESVASLAQVPGVFGAMFRTSEQAKSAANDLRSAQAEAEVRCFESATSAPEPAIRP
jgi:hypothetical protein